MKSLADAKSRATALQLHGLLAHWPDCAEAPWLETLLSWEETERARRSLERRLRCAHTLITTNKAFSEWSEVFPNASCVVAMIDRLVHHAEIIPSKGDSCRRKEAGERAAAWSKKRRPKEVS